MRLLFILTGLCAFMLLTPLTAEAGNDVACKNLQGCLDTCPNHETGQANIACERICRISLGMTNAAAKACTDDDDCFATGCSGEVCADEEVFTTCDWKPWYVCFDLTECTRQTNNQCGWTENPDYLECLDANSGDGNITTLQQ